MPKFVTASFIAVFIYAITILTRFGYASYFNLPSDFVTSSLKENVIFFFQLSQLAVIVFTSIHWWMWIVLGIIGFVIFLVYIIFIHRTKLATLLVVGGGIALLFGFYHFGNLLAANTINFYTLPADCPSIGPDKIYIVADIYDGKAIFVPIDNETKKLKNGLVVKEVTSLGCQMEMTNIGKIGK